MSQPLCLLAQRHPDRDSAMIVLAGLAALLIAWPDASAASAPRSGAAKAEFQRAHPCPSTGRSRGSCPGYEVDHVQPLCAGGPDEPANMQWLTVEQHADKTRRDVAGCKGRVYRPPLPASAASAP